MGGESSKGPAEETSKGNPKETNEFVIEGVGTVPLETPPKKLKPFFRKKFRTLFRGENASYVEEYVKRAFSSPEARRRWIQTLLPIARRSFAPFDLDGSGTIERSEFDAFWRAYDVPEDQISQYMDVVFGQMDQDDNGVISVDEYCHAYLYFLLCSGPHHPFSMLFGPLKDNNDEK